MIHYFRGYAVYDRVNLGGTSDVPPQFSMPDPAFLAPSISGVSRWVLSVLEHPP